MSTLIGSGLRTDRIIATDGLRKSFRSPKGTVDAVNGVSIEVDRGEIFGFLGPNGAGKTTTLRMLTTLLPIDAGVATVAGFDVARQPQEVRSRIGYVSQLGGADDLATGRENLILQGRLYGGDLASVKRRTEALMGILDLSEFADRRVKTYSGGQRRRLDIALGIIHQPEVLFLDEPSTGLDPQNRANLWDHVRDLRDRGATIFLTTHYLEEADALCDRLMIMDHGEIIVEGTPRDLKRRGVGRVGGAQPAGRRRDRRPGPGGAGRTGLRPGDHRRGRPGAALRGGRQHRPPPDPPPARRGEHRHQVDEALRAHPRRRLPGSDRTVVPRRRAEHDQGGGRMKTARDTGLLFQRYTLQMLRNPVWLFVGFSTPILYLVLFTPLLKELPGVRGFPTGSVLDVFLPGILALLAFASGSSAGFGTIFELQSGLIERLRVTPASRFAILVGPILSGLVMMTVFDAVVVAVGYGFGFTVHWAGLLVLTVLLWLLAALMGAFSTATALVTKDISSFAAIINGINLPILLAGRGAPSHLPRPPVAAGPGPLQSPLLPGGGGPCPGRRPSRRSRRLAGLRRAGAAVRPGHGLGHPGVPTGGVLTGPDRLVRGKLIPEPSEAGGRFSAV